jgi:hypothetical protein
MNDVSRNSVPGGGWFMMGFRGYLKPRGLSSRESGPTQARLPQSFLQRVTSTQLLC